MGSCQSKKETLKKPNKTKQPQKKNGESKNNPKQLPKSQNTKDILKKVANNGDTKNSEQEEKIEKQFKTEGAKNNDEGEEQWNENCEDYIDDFLEACFEGKEDVVRDLIKKFKIKDISFIYGFEGSLKLGQGKIQKTYDLNNWNPLLIAISQKHFNIVQLIFDEIPGFHFINCVAKPYDLETQKKKIYHHEKRLKRECFGLKLAIINQDIDTLKFLWTELRNLWNLGHFMQCLKMLMKYDWDSGLVFFLGASTTKIIFMSINNPIDFIDTVDLLKYEINQYDEINPQLAEKFREYFYSKPYIIFNLFLIIVSYESKEDFNIEEIQQCLNDLEQDDIQLKHSDITEVFSLLGENNEFMQIQTEYFKRFQNKDDEINTIQQKLIAAFCDPNSEDNEEYVGLLDELDLFAFSQLKFNDGLTTNALVEALNRGFNSIIDFAFQDGFVNIRASLKKNNIFEIENDISQFTISFFLNHADKPEIFQKIYDNVIDLFQLSNFLELFDYAFENQNIELFHFILNDIKFKSLFESSLEFQKILFTKELIEMAQQNEELTELLKAEPFDRYFQEVAVDDVQVDAYCKFTLAYLQEVQAEKQAYSKMSDASRDSFIKQKEERLSHLQKQTNNTLGVRQTKMPTANTPTGYQQENKNSAHSVASGQKNNTLSSSNNKTFKSSLMGNNNEDTFAAGAAGLKGQNSIVQKLMVGRERSDDRSNKKEYDNTEDELKDIIEEDELLINQSRQNIMKRAKPEGHLLSGEYSGSRAAEQMSIRTREAYYNLSMEILDCIKNNNVNKLRFLLRKYDIKNIQSIKNFDTEQLTVVGRDKDRNSNEQDQEIVYYDTSLWNPVLLAIYYQKTEIVRILLEDFTVNFVLALRLPPVTEFTEYIIPGQKQTPGQWGHTSRGKTHDSVAIKTNMDSQTDQNFYGFGTTTKQPYPDFPLNYNPSEARVECFGLELAIRNKDIQTLKYLWDDQIHKWEDRHFAFVFDKILQEHWDIGLGMLFKAKTSHIIFKSLSPEDKDNFLVSKIIDKITDTEFWQNAQSPIKVTRQQEEIVLTELSYDPYGPYSVLKFPSLFQTYDLLENTIKRVTFDDIHDFVMARKENVNHFELYVTEYQKQNAFYNKPKVAGTLLNLLKKAQQIKGQGRKMPTNPEKIVQLIKVGDAKGLKRYFELDDNYQLLEMLNLLTGYEDKDYMKMFQQNIKYVPADDIMRLLLVDNTTVDWNPLIFAIFYQKQEIVEFFVDNSLVYVRSCMTKPFQIEMEDEVDNEDEEKFVQEKTEIFIIVLCIMLNNKEIFRYLWKKNSFMWNEIHLVLLTNYILESQWVDGLKALFALSNTKQIFNSMNLFEKEKFLKFCERSVSKVNTIFLKDFRYQMSFDPYNIYYLPILATPDELHAWEKELSKELFLKQCQQNFDERSYIMMSKFNNHYINEFISTAMTADSEVLINFAKKLKRFAGPSLK